VETRRCPEGLRISTLSIALTTLFGTVAAAVGLHVLVFQAAHPLLAFRRLALVLTAAMRGSTSDRRR